MDLRWLFRVLRYERDAKAIAKGRINERMWNRAVSKQLRRVAQKLYQ